MKSNNLKEILRENVLKLLTEDLPLKPNETGVSRLIKLGIPNGTAQRVLGAEASVGLEVIEQVAEVLGIAPWRLLRSNGDFNTAESAPSTGFDAKRLASQIQRLPDDQRKALRALILALAAKNVGSSSLSVPTGDA